MDWDMLFEKTVHAQYFLDTIIEKANLPTEEHMEELRKKRKRGLGYFGLADAMIMLGIKYGSPESIEFTEKVQMTITMASLEANIDLAITATDSYRSCDIYNSVSPEVFDEDFINSPFMNRIFDEYRERKYFFSSNISSCFSEGTVESNIDAIKAKIRRYGIRFTHATAIAPTGTISLAFGNNCGYGIEPIFDFVGKRNVIMAGKKTREQFDIFNHAFIKYIEYLWDKEIKDPILEKKFADLENENQLEILLGYEKRMEEGTFKLPDYFVKATELSWKEHIDVMAAASKFVDQAISKTINLPQDITFEEFKEVYWYAYKSGLKGCTTYRPNPSKRGAVLVDKKVEEQTNYTFSLEDGTEVTLKGNEKVMYDGEIHIASQLYEAIATGAYGTYS
jgi:ribonucleoside-diphosphate reductase alpha chain